MNVKEPITEREKSKRLTAYLAFKRESEENQKELQRKQQEDFRLTRLDEKSLSSIPINYQNKTNGLKHKKKKLNSTNNTNCAGKYNSKCTSRQHTTDTNVLEKQSYITIKSKKMHENNFFKSEFFVSDLTDADISQSKHVATSSSAENEKPIHSCRICQSDDDNLINQLTSPCGCNGSLQFVHQFCLKKWRQTKQASGMYCQTFVYTLYRMILKIIIYRLCNC